MPNNTNQSAAHGPEINGTIHEAPEYSAYHRLRIEKTLQALGEMGSKRLIELGGHPWVMTAALVEDPRFDLRATVSAEEIARWPDDIGLQKTPYEIRTPNGTRGSFLNFSVNLERRLFDLGVEIDTVLACEIIEHLIRAPHVMMLNANRWLPLSGKLLLTTPNGAQLVNPFRRRTASAQYRCNLYERHSFLYTLPDLVDLVELCGFQIVEAGYWNCYPLQGPSRLVGLLARLPVRYFQDKCAKTIYLIARKDRDLKELSRAPKVLDPRGAWEYIRQSAASGPST